MTILLKTYFGTFAEDKETAKEIRQTEILPALERGELVVLDFAGIRYATQSFIHALIHEALHIYHDDTLDKIEFRNCSAAVKTIIEIVVSYSLDPPVFEVA